MRLRVHLAVYAACLGLVARWTWPLAGDPAHLVLDNTDPRLFSWVMISVFRNLLERPHLLLDGSGFYPYGLSLTFAEPLVTPALVAGPLFQWSGNPYLAYNLTLLLFWAGSGWAMYVAAYRITRLHAAAAVAMLIFLLAPPRMEYAVEFQMEILFGLPLAVYALVRYLDTQRLRHLGLFLAVFWLQAIAVWYFAVILGLGLGILALAVFLQRWSDLRLTTLLAAGAGGLGLGLALTPVAWPFFVTHRELGLERSMGDALDRSANVLGYVTTRGTWLGDLVHVDFASETTLFPGLLALGLATLGAASVWADRRGSAPRSWPERLVLVAMSATLVVAMLTVAGHGRVHVGPAWTRLPSVTACAVALLGCLLLREALAGWRRWREGIRGPMTDGEWVRVLGVMGLFAFLLSLGPVVWVGGRRAGLGLYAWLHPYVLPLRAIRGTTRFGLLVLTVVALLAALGAAWLLRRWSGTARQVVTAGLLGALVLDYTAPAQDYQWIETYARPVDAALRADPDDVAVLEWPFGAPGVDVDAMLRTIGHGHRVVNGYAGFVPGFQRELDALLTASGPLFGSPPARTALARIYPLHYLVVRDAARHRAPGDTGQTLADRSEGFLRFRGTHGEDDLYEVVPVPEGGNAVERVVSYDLLRSRPLLRATVRPVRVQAGVEQWVNLTLNDTTVARVPLDVPTTVAMPLTAPLRRAEPNVIAFELEYRRHGPALGAAHRLGASGPSVPVDAVVQSAGQPYGDRASIRVGLGERAPNRRGYNLVAISPSGVVEEPVFFDTFAKPEASADMAAWVTDLPPGTIVLGAVKDEASLRLGADAVDALATLGVRGDLRGGYRQSHAFIGVKGAPPGSAREAFGPRAVEVRVGEPDARFGLELEAFELVPGPGAR